MTREKKPEISNKKKASEATTTNFVKKVMGIMRRGSPPLGRCIGTINVGYHCPHIVALPNHVAIIFNEAVILGLCDQCLENLKEMIKNNYGAKLE